MDGRSKGFTGPVDRLPYALAGMGVLFILVLLGELVAFRLATVYDGFRTGVVTSIPFILGHMYAGYWLERSAIPTEHYGRIARWWAAGILATVLIIVWINASTRPMSPNLLIGTVRWSSAIGGGVGMVIGMLQVRAIQKAVEAERIQFRLDEAKRQRDRLEEFANVVAHDLRNPLNVAQGRVTLAREECDSEQLSHVEASLERMQELIEDLLTLARTGTELSDVEPVNLAGLVTRCWRNVVTADATLTTESNRTIRADQTRLRQLLQNLIRNAVEHSNTGVTVTVGELDNGFYVEDDGHGIPEADRDAVFEAGYSTTEDGTGFGLSIVKQVAEAHGWDVRVTDGSAGGARFEITGVEFAT